MIKDQTLEYLAKALNSKDKQTCILSAKSLYLASKTHEFGYDVLIELKDHTENKIHDVAVYSSVAYTRVLAKLSSTEKPIMKSYIEFLPRIYVFEDLHCNQALAIEILYNYSANKYSIPQDTIFALGNAISIPEISYQALRVLSNVIRNRQIVSKKFLLFLADNLYSSHDSQLRDESFELLDIANDNQDMSDEIFCILELERAIITVNSFPSDSNDAISYVYKMTEQNQRLTLNGFIMLHKIMNSPSELDEKVFGIFLNISKNAQPLPDNLINKLVERFDPRQANCHLIDIFENLVKNNQNISAKLTLKLEKALENSLISDQVLSIFVLLALKGEYLSKNIIIKILDKILILQNSLIIQQYLSVICSLIQNKDYFKENFIDSFRQFFNPFSDAGIRLVSRIQSVLIHLLKGNDQNVIRKSLNGLKILITFHKVELNQKSIDILLDLTGNTICDENMKNDINILLNTSTLDYSQQCRMKLVNLKYNSNDELLEELAKSSKPKLFQQNFNQIDNIINNYPELNEKALTTLLQCSNKENMTDTLLYSITILMLNSLAGLLEYGNTFLNLEVELLACIALISKVMERFTLSQIERFDFYETWLEIEEYTGFPQGQSDILLKLLHRIQLNNRISFNQCNELIKVLTNIDFESIYNILSISPSPYEDVLKKILRDLIFQRLLHTEINNKYIDDLVRKMITKFNFDISKKLLDTVQTIDSLKDFEELLDFAEENKIKIFDIHTQYISISMLKRLLEIKFLDNQIIYVDHSKLAFILSNLLNSKWTFEQLNIIFKNLDASNNEEKRIKEINFFCVLEILSQYNIFSTAENQEKILVALKEPAQNWHRLINIIAIEANFPEIGQLRNVTELIPEFETNNSQNKDLIELVRKNLVDLINKIKSTNLTSKILSQTMQYKYDEKLKKRRQVYINEWTKHEIQGWAKTIKDNGHSCKNTDDFIVETLAVIKQAYLLDSGFHLTDAQLLSCIILLKANTDKGMLLQIRTGEGKSTIIAVLAVIHVLKGKNVDVITSSPVLAERAAKEKKNFYNMFNLQCSDNNDKSIYWTGPKSCYNSEIVYGEVAQFQFDTLRTEYSQLNTLGNRKFEVAIVDEVDSMLIDDSSKITRLATTIPGIDQLQIIYHTLWYRLVYLQERILEINNKIYLFHGKISSEQEKIILEYIDEQQGNIIKIPDLKTYVESTSDISHIGISISENVEVEAFIKDDLRNNIRNLIDRLTIIPKGFEEFIDTQMWKWIDNALTALTYQENVHYVVHQGLIKPVDYASTGIVQNSSHWSDGLHQFLQLKHNLKMTSETFTTNFLSNKGFFIKYGSNLFGLTGTLGSEKAKQVLVDIYNVHLGIIPSLRQKQYLSLPDLVLTNEVDWLNEICHSAINESRKERGILVICETIEYSAQIAEKIRRDYRSSTIKLYTMNNMNQEKHIEKIYPREIIVATNLPARGNDIKTDHIEKYGGLHVIVTFMPSNKRVEEQAFGRTARQGKRGTGQRIINAASLAHYKNFNIQKITELRDNIEVNMLDDFQKRELQIITLKDELFTKFCLLLNEIRQKIREKNSLYVKIENQAKRIFTNISPSVLESNILLSIEEQWAMFLYQIDNQQAPTDSKIFHKQFEKFSKKIRDNYENDCIIKNPYCHIAIANDLVINDSSLYRNYDNAMKHFDRAIELDSKHSAAAFAGKGWLLLKGKENFFRSNEQSIDYKEMAIRLFNKALEILSEEMSALTVIQSFLQHRCQNMNTDLSKQLIQKYNILGSYCNSLENTVKIIKKSQRLIQITELVDYSKLIEDKYNSKSFSNEVLANLQYGIFKRIISYDGIEKGCVKWYDIRLIPYNRLDHYKTLIPNSKEIIVTKEKNNIVTVFYIQKNKDRLREWIVNDSTLSNALLSLSYDETILDRDIHMKIYILIYEKLKSKNSHIREEFPAFLQESTDHNQYEVTFNDLTVRQDSGTKDQAIEIIDKILYQNENDLFDRAIELSPLKKVKCFSKKSGILDYDYEHINITIQQINAEKLRDFLNPNIEVKELTKEEALTQLKENTCFFDRYLLPETWSLDSSRINLEITSENNNIPEKMTDLSVKVAMKLIAERIDQNERFNLSFESANQTAKILEKVLYRSNITIEFIGLIAENVEEKLRTIVSRSITLEFTDNKETLLKVIDSLTTERIQLYSRVKEHDITEVVNKIGAEQKISEITDKSTTMKLIDVNKSIVDNILDIRPNANFNITFTNIQNKCLLIGLKDELINVQFDMLQKKAAKTIIEQIRKHKLEFSLLFTQLTSHEAKQIIELAPIEQENMEVHRFKTLSELFMSQLRPNLELAEFSGRGIEYLIEINEKKFIPRISIASICALASI
ncbi:unnamed protein product [Rotaria sordida]|uniref:Protein translocase subunit SecA n=1 Tax=Rotaria sordida TaxID=392033 RepID=A0A819DZS6_9BILA|nr:unnamed protein product [Rotaria sordida]